jgi:hypothetical protein
VQCMPVSTLHRPIYSCPPMFSGGISAKTGDALPKCLSASSTVRESASREMHKKFPQVSIADISNSRSRPPPKMPSLYMTLTSASSTPGVISTVSAMTHALELTLSEYTIASLARQTFFLPAEHGHSNQGPALIIMLEISSHDSRLPNIASHNFIHIRDPAVLEGRIFICQGNEDRCQFAQYRLISIRRL